MRFWEIAETRNPMFFHTKSVPEPRWSTSAVRRLRDGLVCGRIMGGSCSDRFRIVNPVSPVLRACGVCKLSSHLHIFSFSHLLIFTSSHLHTLSSSHPLIFTSSHLHTLSSSHLLIFTPSHLTSSHIFAHQQNKGRKRASEGGHRVEHDSVVRYDSWEEKYLLWKETPNSVGE